jgi:hypothetical protein
MGRIECASQMSSNTVHSAVTAGSAGGFDSASVATVLGPAQVQGEPPAQSGDTGVTGIHATISRRYGVIGPAKPRGREKGVQAEDF